MGLHISEDLSRAECQQSSESDCRCCCVEVTSSLHDTVSFVTRYLQLDTVPLLFASNLWLRSHRKPGSLPPLPGAGRSSVLLEEAAQGAAFLF